MVKFPFLVILVKLLKHVGILPHMLFEMSNIGILFDWHNFGHMLPLKWLDYRFKTNRFVRLSPIYEGIFSNNLLFVKSIKFKIWHLLRDEGNSPIKSLLRKYNDWIDCKEPNDFGIFPKKWLFPNLELSIASMVD